MKNKLFILFVFVFFNFYNLYTQTNRYLADYDRTRIIYKQLDAKVQNVVKKNILDEENANKQMNLADKYYQELAEYRQEAKSIKKQSKRYKLYKKMEKVENAAIRNRIEALDNFHAAAVRKYQLFKDDVQKFYKQPDSSKINSAKKLEKLAHNAFSEADLKVQIAYHTVNQGEQFDIYTKAYVLEEIGLLYQHKIYAMFLNWNEETVKHIDKEIEALLKNEPLNSITEANENPLVKDSIVYKEVFVHDTIIVKEKKPNLIYRVQIAASKVPISIKDLHKIYSSNAVIHTSVEDGWYKYSVGMFSSYREAQKFKINIGIKDAFVVAYLNNKRIDISDALKKENL